MIRILKKIGFIVFSSAFIGLGCKANEADSLRRIRTNDLKTQIQWVKPATIRV